MEEDENWLKDDKDKLISIKKANSFNYAPNSDGEGDEDKEEISKRRSKKSITKLMKKFKRGETRARSKSVLSLKKSSISSEIRDMFKGDIILTNNINSRTKEKKINDTIVAIISFIMIILGFTQLFLLIDLDYSMTSTILTLRSCILIFSIPNCKHNLVF